MKNSPLTTFLLMVLTASALASAVLCALYSSNTRQLRALQAQLSVAQNRRAALNMIVKDVEEYGKKNPSINPILDSLLRPQSSAPPTGKPPVNK